LSTRPIRRAQAHGPRGRVQWAELGRFVIVGIANTVLSVVVYRLLLAAGVWYAVAAPAAYAASLLNGYFFNRIWTFGAQDSARARATYVGVQLGGAVLMSVAVLFLVNVAGIGQTAAFLAAAVPVTLCTFTANRVWTFADRRR
jgi:putative flippase GtrA